MSEERRDREQEGARRVLSPVRLAVLLLLGAFFLVLGGSRADAAEAAPALEEAPGVVRDTLEAVDAEPVLAPVAAPLTSATEPLLEPVLEPVVRPVVEPVLEPVVAPLRPALEPLVAPLATLPVIEPAAPALGERSARPAAPAPPSPPAHRAAAEGRTPATAQPGAAGVEHPADAAAVVGERQTADEAPAHGTPVSRSLSSTGDGGTGAPVPYAVLLAVFAAVLALAAGVVPRRVAPPLAPTFLPPVFPG